MATEKCGGFKRPEFKGTVVGQVVGRNVRVPTGKRFPAMINGQKVWLPVIETRYHHYWVWDGTEWLSAPEFRARYELKEPAKRPLVSKLDFDAAGNRIDRRTGQYL